MVHNPLRDAQYLISAHRLDQLPSDSGREVAFAGRSNAGKSTALNALCEQRALARTSRTPGRTQQMVVFPLADPEQRLVDLPGYGYAKVPVALREHWRGVLDAYLRQRQSLVGVVLVMDVRHPLREFDRLMLDFAAASGRDCHLLLTKADKLSRNQGMQTLLAVRRELAGISEGATVQLFSAQARTGLEEARARILGWLSPAEAATDTAPA